MSKKLIACTMIFSLVVSLFIPNNNVYANTIKNNASDILNNKDYCLNETETSIVLDQAELLKSLGMTGILTDINITKANDKTAIEYTVDYGGYINAIQLSESNSIKDTILCKQNGLINIVELYKNGDVIVDGHKITCTTEIEAEDNNTISPRDVTGDVNYVTKCPYGSADDYIQVKGVREKKNLNLDTTISSLTSAAFNFIMFKLFDISTAGFTIVLNALYNILVTTYPSTRGLSCRIYEYYHKNASSSGYISSKKATIIKMNHLWYPNINFQGGVCERSTLYYYKQYF